VCSSDLVDLRHHRAPGDRAGAGTDAPAGTDTGGTVTQSPAQTGTNRHKNSRIIIHMIVRLTRILILAQLVMAGVLAIVAIKFWHVEQVWLACLLGLGIVLTF